MSFFDELKRRNVLRVAIVYLAGAWLLIQVLETLFPIFGIPETSVRIVVIILGILFVPAVILAWIFEATPDGIQLDADARESAQDVPADRKTLDRVIIVTLMLALGYFAVDKFILDPARDAVEVEAAAEKAASDALIGSYGDNSIVVLPFINMSSDPEQDYFSDGISEEVLNLLAKIRELRVISRSSAFAFKGQDIEISAIAERLNVAHVLEGSVRKSGNTIRITAQLIDARTDTHLWSETYDRELDDVFAIQDEISAHVVEQLKITILGDLPQSEQIDAEAYSRYLRGYHIAHSGQWDKLPLAEQLMIEALEIEPDYIPALNAMGVIYNAFDEERFASPAEQEQLLRELAARVAEAEPGGTSDLGWQAYLVTYFDRDPVKAAKLYERALALDPRNMNTLRLVGFFLNEIGHFEEAIATFEYVISRDPACILCLGSLSIALRSAGRYGEAVEILEDAIEWDPDRHMINWSLGSVLLQAGRPEEALAAFEMGKDDGQVNFGRIFALHDLDRMEEYEEEFARWRSENEGNPEGFARIYAWTGNSDLAMEWIEKMIEFAGPDTLNFVTSGGFYVKLMADPRLDALLREHGKHPDQQEKIPFNFTPPQ